MRLGDKITIGVIFTLIGFFSILICIENKKTSEANSFSSEDVIPHKSRVIIANGCGVPGIAAEFRDVILKKSYIASSPQNEPYWTYDETIVLSLDGNMDVARELAEDLHIKNCFMYKKEGSYEPLKVIIGKDYKEILKKNESNTEKR